MYKKYGISCGPITQTTRSVYEKKISNFLEESNKSSKNNYQANIESQNENKFSQLIARQFNTGIKNTLIFNNYLTINQTYIHQKDISNQIVEESSNMSLEKTMNQTYIKQKDISNQIVEELSNMSLEKNMNKTYIKQEDISNQIIDESSNMSLESNSSFRDQSNQIDFEDLN